MSASQVFHLEQRVPICYVIYITQMYKLPKHQNAYITQINIYTFVIKFQNVSQMLILSHCLFVCLFVCLFANTSSDCKEEKPYLECQSTDATKPRIKGAIIEMYVTKHTFDLDIMVDQTRGRPAARIWQPPHAKSLLALIANEMKNTFPRSSSEVEDIVIQFKILLWLTEYFLKKWSWTSISLKKKRY